MLKLRGLFAFHGQPRSESSIQALFTAGMTRIPLGFR